MLMKLGILINGAVAALVAIPIIGYTLSPLLRKGREGSEAWISLGRLTEFPEGQTRLTSFRNPFVSAWDGRTADIPCWVRHIEGETFQVFAINCAHLGCPVACHLGCGGLPMRSPSDATPRPVPASIHWQEHDWLHILADYWTLTKPEVNFLILITTFAGFRLSCLAGQRLNFLLLFQTLVGTVLVASGTAALNQFIERKFDGQMRRTA